MVIYMYIDINFNVKKMIVISDWFETELKRLIGNHCLFVIAFYWELLFCWFFLFLIFNILCCTCSNRWWCEIDANLQNKGQRPFYEKNNSVLNLFVCLRFFVPLKKIHSYGDVTIASEGICSALMVIEQWGFFREEHLPWNGESYYNGHLQGPVTLTLSRWTISSGSGTTFIT